MSVSPLYPISNLNSYISGEVMVDPSAAIAPGVLLQADPNSQIIIGAGVCIGMGAVLHAHDGILEIQAGANLGAGVLVVGKGKIGANACIGSATTILNHSIESGQVVASGSLIGDTSRSAELPAAESTTASPPGEATVNAASQPEEQETAKNQPVPESSNNSGAQVVYGKDSLRQLMSALFPHSQSLNQPLQDGSSQSDVST